MPLGSVAFWGVVLPVEKTNLMLNPSHERGTSGVAAIQGATLGSAPNEQAFGAWSCSVAPSSNGTSGAAFGTWTAGAGTDYTVSAYVNGQVGVNYALFVGDSSGVNVQNGSTAFVGGGTFQRIAVSYTEASGAVRRPVVRKTSGNSVGTFYVDGVQVEVGSLTTYLDGDQEGCTWLGAPHQSTSLRSGQSRAGGSVVALADLGYRVQEAIGIGMPPLETTSQSYALIPGAEFQSQRAGVRPFVLTSTVIGTTWQDFHNQRRAIIDALKIDAVSEQQPVRFWYTGGMGTVQIDAVLDSGMEGGNRNGLAEDYGARFLAHNPYWAQTIDQGTALAPRTSIGSSNYIVKRDSLGRWGTLGVAGASVDNIIADMELLTDGRIALSGAFTTAGGTAARSIALYDPITNTFGTLIGGTIGNFTSGVQALASDAAGTLYIGGDFGTVAGTVYPRLAFWNGNAFGTLRGGTVDNTVRTLKWWAGTLFMGGDFFTAGGTTARFIAEWTPNNFGTLKGQTGNGTLDGAVYAMTIGLDNGLYFGGDFGSVGGTTAPRVGFWRNDAFGTMPIGIGYNQIGGGRVVAMDTAPDGQIYIGGVFGTAGSVTATNVAVWNGVQLQALGSGLGTVGNAVQAILARNSESGTVLAGGKFTQSGPLKLPDGQAVWNGAAWLPFDIDLNQTGAINAMLYGFDGALYVAGSFAGTARVASVAQVVNVGAAVAYPTMVSRNTSTGTARVYQLQNTTTGDSLLFDLVLQAGEVVTLNLKPGQRSFQSSFQGNVFGRIRQGSNLASWRLLPGTNYVSFLADNDSVVTSLYWRPVNWSADGTMM